MSRVDWLALALGLLVLAVMAGWALFTVFSAIVDGLLLLAGVAAMGAGA